MKASLKRLCLMFLIVAMAVCMMPGAGLLTGAEAVYADSIILHGGTVNASDLEFGGDYIVNGDTTIYIDDNNALSHIMIQSGRTLTITGPNGTDAPILTVGGTGI